jgi:nucleotide-binding universal stress UspA family protein
MLPPKVILSPLDFSTHSDEALKVAADFAARFGAELCLVHVVPMIPKLPLSVSIFNEGEYERELHKDAEQRLAQIAADLSGKGLTVTSEIGTANEVAMEILRIAEHKHADLIVIATHGMTGWHKLAFGSVAEKVVRLAECPVLVLRAQPQASASETVASHSAGASR